MPDSRDLIQKVAHKIEASRRTSPTPPGQTDPGQSRAGHRAASEARVQAINQVFALFRLNYHKQYYAAYPDAEQLRQIKKLWLDSLADYPIEQILKGAKHAIEQLIAESAIPYSILRWGTYMEDLFDPRLDLLKKGKFLFPLNKSRRFTFTSQQDVPRFIVRELLAKERVLNRDIDLVAPGTYSIAEIELLLSEVAGFQIRAPSRFPTFHLFRVLTPLFRLLKDRMSSVIPLLVHFDVHRYLSNDKDGSS